MKSIEKEFENLLNSDELKKLIQKAYLDNNVVPKKENVLRAFNFFNINQTKIVILGQDPYPGEGVADGLAFSTQLNKTPASLNNIFKELKNEYHDIQIKTNSLESWAKQGILLLNENLTTIENKPLAHDKIGWNFFTEKIIQILNNYLNGVIFVLWGNNAKKYANFIDRKKHYILTSVHPSPLSAKRGFFGNNHFRKINEILKKNKKEEINWNLY